MGSLDTRHHEILRHPRGQRTEEGLDTGKLSPRCSRAIFPQRLERSEVCRGREWRDLLELAVRMIVSDRKFDRGTSLDLQDLLGGFDLGLLRGGLLLGFGGFFAVGFFWVGFLWGRFSATSTTFHKPGPLVFD